MGPVSAWLFCHSLFCLSGVLLIDIIVVYFLIGLLHRFALVHLILCSSSFVSLWLSSCVSCVDWLVVVFVFLSGKILLRSGIKLMCLSRLRKQMTIVQQVFQGKSNWWCKQNIYLDFSNWEFLVWLNTIWSQCIGTARIWIYPHYGVFRFKIPPFITHTAWSILPECSELGTGLFYVISLEMDGTEWLADFKCFWLHFLFNTCT